MLQCNNRSGLYLESSLLRERPDCAGRPTLTRTICGLASPV